MEIRGDEVLLPVSAVSAFPRPHWLQGRVLGSLSEPVYRSQNLRVAYEDACKICAHEQEKAGLDILCDGAQYYEWEAPGFQLEPIFHFIPENLGGFAPYGPPGEGAKYRPFYQAVVKGKITWERPIFESVVMTMQNATDKPFKVAFLGPAQQSVIVKDEYYGDQVAVARDLAIAMNSELKYLVSMGLEAVQLIDVLPPYTTDMWQIEMQNIMFDGVDAIKFWHVCYGSVDGQRDIFDNHAASMMPLFKESPADVIHLEFTNKGFDELEAFRDFPTDKVLGVGVVDAKNLQVETAEQIEARIRRALEVMPADRLLVAPDCGLGYFSRTAAYAKLRNMGQAAASVRSHALTEPRGPGRRQRPGPRGYPPPGGHAARRTVPDRRRPMWRRDMTAQTGHEVLGLRLSVGDHICGFYRRPLSGTTSSSPSWSRASRPATSAPAWWTAAPLSTCWRRCPSGSRSTLTYRSASSRCSTRQAPTWPTAVSCRSGC